MNKIIEFKTKLFHTNGENEYTISYKSIIKQTFIAINWNFIGRVKPRLDNNQDNQLSFI